MKTGKNAISCVMLCLSGGIVATPAAAAPARPNIVLILADDMGFSDIGCYGGEIPTPNLDALAAGGSRFTQFYNAGRCCPTRASLLSGLYPHEAGVGDMVYDRAWELYDMRCDRMELHDLAAKRPEQVAAMKRCWTDWARQTNVLPWPQQRRRK